ncbi:hypothetical protein J6590_078832 [Homalodisca vitripennis]|nr:hypothetical protein J6590_078832 [Homalodisca vitripennis]
MYVTESGRTWHPNTDLHRQFYTTCSLQLDTTCFCVSSDNVRYGIWPHVAPEHRSIYIDILPESDDHSLTDVQDYLSAESGYSRVVSPPEDRVMSPPEPAVTAPDVPFWELKVHDLWTATTRPQWFPQKRS